MTSRITCGHGHQEGQCPCQPCDFHLPSKDTLLSTIAAKDAEIERLEDEVAKLYEQRIAMFDKINEIERILRGD